MHTFLATNYSQSQAYGIWASGLTTYVVGSADSDAILWTIRSTQVYVNCAYAGTNSDGSLQAPYKTATAGYQAAQANDVITIFGGSYNEAILMNKPLLLQATNGVVNIGR